MARLSWLLLILAILVGAVAAYPSTSPKKLFQVFQVDTRDPNVHSSSCRSPFIKAPRAPDTSFNNKPMYDPSKEWNHDDENILNNVWRQMLIMVWHARVTLETSMYTQSSDVMQLVYSFWGIVHGSGPDPAQMYEPGGHYLEKMNEIRDRYKAVQDYMEKERPDGPNKYKIFCDGTYFKKQEATDLAKDKLGMMIMNPVNGQPWKLRDYEIAHGRDFDQFVYFWYDVVFDSTVERGYYVEDASTFDWPQIPGTNDYNICRGQVFAEVLSPPYVESGNMDGTDAWYGEDDGHIILCPNSFKLMTPLDNLAEQPLGTKLASMGIAAITFLHEMFHVVFPYDSDDMDTWMPLRSPNTKTGTPSPDWPLKKSGFTQERLDAPILRIDGPVQAFSLGMYELAAPETTNVDEMHSWRTPEVYAWYARTAWLLLQGRQDWSTGVCRESGSDFVGPTALPPELGIAKRTEAKNLDPLLAFRREALPDFGNGNVTAVTAAPSVIPLV